MNNFNLCVKLVLLPPPVVTLTLCMWCIPILASAQQTTYGGFTGIISTPNALIANTGELAYQYNNEIEPRFLDEHTEGTNHVFALGIYPRFEIGGRLTDFTPTGEQFRDDGVLRGKRDLSGNAKLNLVNYNDKLWLSAGALDFGGLAQNFKAVYVVATGRWNRFDASAGLATGENPSFDGGFANLHITVNPYLSLMAELDTGGSAHAGLTASVPLSRKLRLGATFATGEDDVRAGLNISYRLGENFPQPQAITAGSTVEADEDKQNSPPSLSDNNDVIPSLASLEQALSEAGFTDTRVGVNSSKSYVAQVENTALRHSDLAAFDTVLGIARTHLPSDAQVDISLLNSGLVKYTATFSTDAQTTAGEDLAKATPSSQATTTWNISEHATGKSFAHVTVQPELRTAIGTEFGSIDYSLGVRTGVTVPLWSGAHAIAAGIVPLANSNNFEDGRIFSRDAYSSSLERAMLVQYFPLGHSAHTMVELGRVQVRNFFYDAVRAQAAWQASTRPLLLHASAAQYSLVSTTQQREVLLGTASYSLPRYGANVSATAGQFFFGDHGVRIDGTRRFGNTFVTAFIKVIDTDNLAGGLQLSAPIGPKHAIAWRGFTFSGVSRWAHALQTTIKFPNADDNRLQPGLLFEPLTDSQIPRALMDNGRLNRFDITHFIHQNR